MGATRRAELESELLLHQFEKFEDSSPISGGADGGEPGVEPGIGELAFAPAVRKMQEDFLIG